jgi:xanthine/uracil permease
MSKRPRNLVFARDERPRPPSIVVLAFQHAALSVLFLIYAAMVAKGAGFTPPQQQALLVGSLIACGLGAIVQAASPRWSSGLLVIPIATPLFVVFGIEAGKEAGPGGIATLAIAGGMVQIAMGQVLPKLRAFFPAEVCGVVVLMLGVSILPLGFHRLLGTEPGSQEFSVDPQALAVGLITMGSIVAASIWLKGSKRFFALLIGCGAGYAAAGYFGLLADAGAMFAGVPLLSPPRPVLPSFDVGLPLIAAFVLLAIVSAVDDMGVFISTDRLDDAEWSKPDMAKLSRGVSSMGSASIVSGFLGGGFLGLSSTNIGLAFATGVTSRIVGVAAGIIMIAASFFPALLALVTAMPDAVIGGILAYAASYFIVAGADLALSRMLSPRRMVVIGLPVAAGIAVQATPAVAEGTTGMLAVILHSPLILSSLLAIGLNALMRIGIAQTASISVPAGGHQHERILETLDEWGELWGLRRTTVAQANAAVNQLIEAVADLGEGDIRLEARHDELNVDLSVIYTGAPLSIPDRAPTAEEMLNDADGVSRMAGWLVRNLADRATPFTRKGQQGVMLRFES